MKYSAQLRRLLPIALALLAIFGVTVAVQQNTDGSTSIKATVNTPSGPTSITAAPDDVEKAADGLDSHGGKDETPPGMTEAQVSSSTDQIEAFAQRDQLPLVQPNAAPEQPGCFSRFHGSYSSRGGVKPRAIGDHYTVSPNLPGLRDLVALTAYSSNPRNGVSWHYNIDRDGNCFYTVRETDKAWTQAAANPYTIGIEIINRGAGDGPLFTATGLKKAARIHSDIAARWDIPIRRGKVNKSTCRLIRSGIVDHNDFGACGGGHHDITPYDVDNIIAATRIYRQSQAPLERKIAKWCRSLKIVRAKIRAHKSNASQRSRGRKLKTLLVKRDASCV